MSASSLRIWQRITSKLLHADGSNLPGAGALLLIQNRQTVTPSPHYDGYQWRKYGQKRITKTHYPRSIISLLSHQYFY